MSRPDLYLASRSPRRRELLTAMGCNFSVVDIEVDERTRQGESPADYVTRLARAKAHAGVTAIASASAGLDRVVAPVIGADTSVVIDDEILGKPVDYHDAVRMLKRLSGREHQVLTGVAVDDGVHSEYSLSVSLVRFRALSDAEIDRYWASGEPVDKAGAYAIQGSAAVFVEHMSGSYSGIVGLPLYELNALLLARGIVLNNSTRPSCS